ncbi:calcium-dependent phosphotriesterase [Myriangium duriaei CBS 260.36]|uniref:Calcium-dependent phosphotriesterase n=1 Tax=Myriangium duriaei CBS 260.36 TaxID=1168546 RepID=A0A9P4J6U6_9PEZI|nr:calcium-dependent phosphotriesterase [Myriangium duriaei CBS 260.36]
MEDNQTRSYHRTNTERPQVTESGFRTFNAQGQALLGTNPSIHEVLTSDQPLFHEAGVFYCNDSEDSLFVTSNILSLPHGRDIQITRLSRSSTSPLQWTQHRIPPSDVVMANGAVSTPDLKHILFCSQGSKSDVGGLILMSRSPPYATTPLLRTYHGRRFNSVNDVVFARDGSVWFTDPTYGYEQGFRSTPELPPHVYRYDPATDDLRVVADGLAHPNGLCFSPDGETLYVTDTDYIWGDGGTSERRAATIYAYTVKNYHGAPFLTDRRVFAFADRGAPDGIKCDTEGNVYSGCGDGVNVWSPGGSLMLKIQCPYGTANFCFGRPGELFLLSEKSFYVARIGEGVRGDLNVGL